MAFIISNYKLFIGAAVVLLLGLFGYMMDRRRYEKYREEIINEERVANAMEALAPSISGAVDPSMFQAPSEELLDNVAEVVPTNMDQIPDAPMPSTDMNNMVVSPSLQQVPDVSVSMNLDNSGINQNLDETPKSSGLPDEPFEP